MHQVPLESHCQNGLRSSMKHTASFSSVLWQKTDLGPVCKENHAMLLVSKSFNSRHGKKKKNKQTTLNSLVADNSTDSGSLWPFLKQCPAISQLQVLLNRTTKCWLGSRGIMPLATTRVWSPLFSFFVSSVWIFEDCWIRNGYSGKWNIRGKKYLQVRSLKFI